MPIARIGGLLVTSGLVLLVATAGNAIMRDTLGNDRNIDRLIAASLGFMSAGAFALAVNGPQPLRGQLGKAGLIGVAIGLLGLALVVVGAGSLRGIELDLLLVPMVGSFAAVGLGGLAIALALAMTRGSWEWPGLVLLAGMMFGFLGTWSVTAEPLGAIAQAMRAAGGIVIILGAFAIGLLATLASESR